MFKKVNVSYFHQTYIPSRTLPDLKYYREEELETLRGTGTGKLKEWDCVYDYDTYNDLSKPDKGAKYTRHILGVLCYMSLYYLNEFLVF